MKDGLLAVRTFLIPMSILSTTIEFLRRVGRDGCEGFVLWSGALAEREKFVFRSCIIPDQKAMATESGLLVTVDGKSLFEVNKNVHERGEILAAQIHSHPTTAYHSSTDDSYPLVTLLGALSIVIPDFAWNAPADVDEWAWYRLSRRGKWDPASKDTWVEIE
jgi:hypothetical protein